MGSLVFHLRIRGRKGRSKGQSHQAIRSETMITALWYTMQRTHSAERADDVHVQTHLGEKGLGMWRGIWRLLCPVPPGLSAPPLGTGQTWPWSRCRDHAADTETRYCSAPHSAEEKNQWALYRVGTVASILSPKKILPLSHLSPFSSTPRPHNRPCVVNPGLELHSPCVRLWTIHKTNRPCDPAHFSHTLSPQIYWIGRVFSPVIDIPPDAVDEDALLTWLHFVFDNSSPIVNETLEVSAWWCVNWWELGFD